MSLPCWVLFSACWAWQPAEQHATLLLRLLLRCQPCLGLSLPAPPLPNACWLTPAPPTPGPSPAHTWPLPRPPPSAADDRKARELIDTKNQADSMVYQTEKQLKEFADKVRTADSGPAEQSRLWGIISGSSRGTRTNVRSLRKHRSALHLLSAASPLPSPLLCPAGARGRQVQG